MDIGDLELCTRVVESGANLGSGFGCCTGCTPLLYSLHKGQLTIAEYLVSQGASTASSTCELWSSRGFNAFHYAAVSGSVNLLRLLLEKAPSEIYISHDPIHPIHLAVLGCHAECVQLMIDHVNQGMNALPYRIFHYGDWNTNTGKGRTHFDQLGTLQEALGRIIDLQVRGDMLDWAWCSTPGEAFPEVFSTAKPIHIAAYKGFSHIVLLLLAHGASMNSEDRNLETPLHYAATNGQTAMVKLLLDSGANPNAVNSLLETPFLTAVDRGDVDSTRLLLKSGANFQLQNRYGQKALHLAARSGARDVFVFLMNATAGHDLDAEDIGGRSILYEAAQGSNVGMTFLLNLAPSAGAYRPRMKNILNTVLEYRSTSEVRMLLRRFPTGLLPELLNHRALNGGTPLHLAAMLSKLDMINLLLDAGAQLELEGSEYGTALMGPCATGRIAAVKLLVRRGARTSYVKDGRSFSALLAAKHHPDVRRWLLVGRFLEGPRLLTYKEVPKES